jgi:hypothetical protein
MGEPKFRVEVSINDRTGEPVAAYLRVREGDVAQTKDIHEGVAFADYDARGLLLGIEILAPCPLAILDQLSANEPEPIRRFLRSGAPRELVPA